MMARGFIAGGGGRIAWSSLKQAVIESLVGPRLYGESARRMIWSGVCCSGGSSSVREEMAGDSSLAGRDSVAKTLDVGMIPVRVFDFGQDCSNCPEGLPILLSHRPDVILRSAPLVRRRSSQFTNLSRLSDCWTSAAFTGVRNLHSSVVTSSSLVKRQMEQSLFGWRMISLTTAASPRNLSLGTWTERWNKSSEQFKKAINLKPKEVTAAGASVELKSGVHIRPREILSEVSKPVQTTFAHYREAVGLQIEAFWKRNYLVVVGVVGLGVCLLLWRLMFGIASTFISLSEGLAKFGFLALAAAMVIVGGVVTRARYTINPDTVYRIAMRKLNTSAAVLEVMGAPLSGTHLRAYIMSGGGFRLKNFRPRLAGKRCFIIFPIRGSERRGLVSIEVKKKKGQYDFKLLAVDVPTTGADQRLYLIGDENEYKVGGGLISELRDPMVKAMAAQKEFEELDMREDEEDEQKAMEVEHLQAQEAIKKSEKNLELAQNELEKPEENQKGEKVSTKTLA